MRRALLLAVLLISVHASPARSSPPGAAAPAGGSGSTPSVPRDDLRGRWVLHETAPIDPIVFVQGSPHFFTINQPGSRFLQFGLGGLPKLLESPAGPGLVSLAARPASSEIWGVDRVTSSVSVFDGQTGRILRTVRVGAEPHGIVFSADGDRAYVSCSADDRVDVISSANFEVVAQIPIPAREPRAMVRVGSTVYVASFLSGNGSSTIGNEANGDTLDVRGVAYPQDHPGTQPLPDRDLFAIPITASPATDVLDPAATLAGLGTLLFALRNRPGTDELWVPHTEALNALHRGERDFVAGQVVRNRVAIVSVTGAAPALAEMVDLDALAPSPELRCAAPTDVAFTSDGSRAFVCGYGSDTVAVLDPTPGQIAWIGTIRIRPSAQYPDGAGARNLGVDPSDRWLIVLDKGENSITQIDLTQLPTAPGFVFDSPLPVPLGWDPTPGDLVQGRIHFIRTANSKSFTSSCNSCHVDGHLDGLAWDLGVFLDPEGTPSDQLAFPIDAKGPMVTQSVRHLKEVGPYHWRGERRRLVDFNNTFVNLLEREEDGVPKNLGGRFRYITQYMEHVAIPANPRQRPDRGFTDAEASGAELFMNEPVLGALTCAACHVLPLGTAGEIVDNRGGGLAPATIVPSLRGVGDKLSTPFVVGGAFGTRTELGVGLGHGGAFASFEDLLLQPLPPPQSGQQFDLDPAEAEALAEFLNAFDTGIAPAAARQATMHSGNVASFVADELDLLTSQAALGHCDLVFRYGPEIWKGAPTWFTGLYLPGVGTFRQPSATLPMLSVADLVAKAQSGVPITFLGVPRHMGWPMGVDRDNDKLLDLDERLRGTNPEAEDTDGDGFHDGYEVQWVMNPLVPNPSSPDEVPPQVVGPVRVVYVTNNAVKFELETSEQARILFSYNGGNPVLRAPLKPRHDDVFSEVLSELEPNTYYQVRMDLEDLAGNASSEYFDFYTSGPGSAPLARIEDLRARLIGSASGTYVLGARIVLGFGQGSPAPGYQVRSVLYYRADDGAQLLQLGDAVVTTDALGVADFVLGLPKNLAPGAGKIHFAVQEIAAPPGGPIHAVGEDAQRVEVLDY